MVYHCSPNFQGDPLVDGPQESSDRDTVLRHAGSRYGPSAPLVRVMQLLDDGVVFALVGKPCDIGAMRRLALVDPRVDKQVPYMLSICEGPTDLVTLRRIAQKMGVGSLSEVDAVRYRGNGCPGPTTMRTQSGESSLTYTQTWFDKRVRLQCFTSRCGSCMHAWFASFLNSIVAVALAVARTDSLAHAVAVQDVCRFNRAPRGPCGVGCLAGCETIRGTFWLCVRSCTHIADMDCSRTVSCVLCECLL